MLCYVVLCCVVLCWVVLCCVVCGVCGVFSCCVVSCCMTCHCTVYYCSLSYIIYIRLYSMVKHHFVSCCIILSFSVILHQFIFFQFLKAFHKHLLEVLMQD